MQVGELSLFRGGGGESRETRCGGGGALGVGVGHFGLIVGSCVGCGFEYKLIVSWCLGEGVLRMWMILNEVSGCLLELLLFLLLEVGQLVHVSKPLSSHAALVSLSSSLLLTTIAVRKRILSTWALRCSWVHSLTDITTSALFSNLNEISALGLPVTKIQGKDGAQQLKLEPGRRRT